MPKFYSDYLYKLNQRGIKSALNSINRGAYIELNSQIWQIVDKVQGKVGRGNAFYKLDLLNIQNNTKLNQKFKSDDSVEGFLFFILVVHLKNIIYKFLYHDGESAFFINEEEVGSELEEVSLKLLSGGEKALKYLVEDMPVKITFNDKNKAISFKLPNIHQYEVVAISNGSDSSSGRNTVELCCGAQITVPSNVKVGDKISVNLATYEYN